MNKNKKVVFFDTNVIMDFYKYPDNVVNKLLPMLEKKFGKNLIIPWRAYDEYKKHLNECYCSSGNMYSRIEKQNNECFNNIKRNIKTIRDNAIIKSFVCKNYEASTKELEDSATKIINKIKKATLSIKSNFKNKYKPGSDPIKAFIERHKSKVLISLAERIKLIKEAETRLRYSIPPGITDVEKEENVNDPYRKIGDFLIWAEIRNTKIDADEVVFVTNETKNDYWDDFDKNKFSHILIKEFNERQRTKTFKAYRFDQFYEAEFYSEDIELSGFFTKQATLYREIFYDHNYIDVEQFLCVDDNAFYPIYGESYDNGTINSIDDFYADEIEIINKNNIDIAYSPSKCEIVVKLKIKLTGGCQVDKFLFHDEGEEICERIWCKGDVTFDCIAKYNVYNNKISYQTHTLKATDFDFETISSEYDDPSDWIND